MMNFFISLFKFFLFLKFGSHKIAIFLLAEQRGKIVHNNICFYEKKDWLNFEKCSKKVLIGTLGLKLF